MLIWVGEPDYKLITAEEGTGDNLAPEDIKDGFVDYWMTTMYKQDGDEIEQVDSGQLLTSTPIKDMEYEEQISRLFDYWGINNNSYSVLEY